MFFNLLAQEWKQCALDLRKQFMLWCIFQLKLSPHLSYLFHSTQSLCSRIYKRHSIRGEITVSSFHARQKETLKPKGLKRFNPMQKNRFFNILIKLYFLWSPHSTTRWLPAGTFLFPSWSFVWFSSEVALPCLRPQELKGWSPRDLRYHLWIRMMITINLMTQSRLLYPKWCLQSEGPFSDATTIPVSRLRSPVLFYQNPPAACVQGSL